MTDKYQPIQPPEQKGFKVDVKNDEQLVITVGKDFDAMVRNSSWAATIVEHYYGPFSEVVVDLRKVNNITSTVIAGLVHFADYYGKQCPDGFFLANVNDRIAKILGMMKLDSIFSVKQDWRPAEQGSGGRGSTGNVGLPRPDWLG